MALAMHGECQRCKAPLSPASEAYICIYECTFCPDCWQTLKKVCPNCGNELVRRPRKELSVANSR